MESIKMTESEFRAWIRFMNKKQLEQLFIAVALKSYKAEGQKRVDLNYFWELRQ